MAELRPEPQYATLDQQRQAANLGVWAFLGTEALFFGGLFTAYAMYRYLFPEAFAVAGQHTKIVFGTANTAILLTSSLFMAVAVEAAALGQRRVLLFALVLTATLGGAFMVVKGAEYYTEYLEGLIPGPSFDFPGPYRAQAQLFFLFYFIATGIHAVHLSIGIGLVSYLTWRAWQGAYLPRHYSTVEGVGLYWHFVDLIWIFLYPLIYLLGRNT